MIADLQALRTAIDAALAGLDHLAPVVDAGGVPAGWRPGAPGRGRIIPGHHTSAQRVNVAW